MRLLGALLFFGSCWAMEMPWNPKADPKQMVIKNGWRFTVLSDFVVRVEYGRTRDTPTLVIKNRNLGQVPSFTVKNVSSTVLELSTSQFTLQFDSSKASGSSCVRSDAFSATFQLNSTEKSTWTGSDAPTGNLGGVQGHLDCYSTPSDCFNTYVDGELDGILSRDGWVVIDDANTVSLSGTTSGQYFGPWYLPDSTASCDSYLMFHGHNYKQAAKDWSAISGPVPMMDRGYLGPWWSRHDPLNEDENKQIYEGYASHNLPLGQAVCDMQWHTYGWMTNPPDVNGPGGSCVPDDDDGLEESLKQGCSWGGYDWNTTAFEDPTAFGEYLHNSNPTGGRLNLLLNVHPQTGVCPDAEKYDAMCKALGLDPSKQEIIKCDFGNESFATALFDIYLNAEELAMVDAWWTDYGGSGGPDDPMYSGTQLLWSNYLFGSNQLVVKQRRPVVLSRRGGLGDQIWPMAFSGDTFQAFDTLRYQINFTARAGAGALQSWSHDTGGFHRNGGSGSCVRGDGNVSDPKSAELYTRWIQAAAFWPLLRQHCRFCERRVWEFEYFSAEMEDALRLRGALIPYLYTAFANLASNSAPHPVRSMFVEYPEIEEAYKFGPTQFFFGDDIFVAPVAAPGDAGPGTTVQSSVWIPPGTWQSWDGISSFVGPQITNVSSLIGDIPIFVRAGAILPLQDSNTAPSQPIPNPLRIAVYPEIPTASSSYTLYEDDGLSAAITPSHATTQIDYTHNATVATVTIHPFQGTFPQSSTTRFINIEVRGSTDVPATVSANGVSIPASTTRPGFFVQTNGTLEQPGGSLIVLLPSFDATKGSIVNVIY